MRPGITACDDELHVGVCHQIVVNFDDGLAIFIRISYANESLEIQTVEKSTTEVFQSYTIIVCNGHLHRSHVGGILFSIFEFYHRLKRLVVPGADGHVTHHVEVVEVPAQCSLFPLSGGVHPRGSGNFGFSQRHAAIGDAVVVVGIFRLAGQVDGRALGLAFVKPAVARVAEGGHRKVADFGHAFQDAVVGEVAADAA